MSTEYVKTYKPLAIWLCAYLFSMLALPLGLAHAVSSGIMTPVMLGIVYLGILALFILIHRGGYVYWINGGPSFEEAQSAGETARRAYAWAHLKRFLLAGAGLMPYLVVSSVFDWPTWLDIGVFGLLVLSAAMSTLRIRFEHTQEAHE